MVIQRKKNCAKCEKWKTYNKHPELKDYCECTGRSSGPGIATLYSHVNSTCKAFKRRIKLHYKKFRDSIKIKTSFAE